MAEKVLLVDDEVGILSSLERLLRRDKYEIIKAEGGQAGLDALEQHPDIAVIICDQRMPDVPGLTVLKKCKELQPKTIRIALTGYCDADTILGCINEAQVSQFLTKPWEDDNLREIIRHAVENYINDKERKRLLAVVKEQYEKIKVHNEELENKVQQRTAQVNRAKQVIENTLVQFSTLISNIIDAPFKGVHGHGPRVATISRQLAELGELDPHQVSQIQHAASIHDIGLVSVPADILTMEESAMNLSERKIFHRHSLTGYEMLKDLPGFKTIAKYVREHHEAFNGSGYPDGLLGEKTSAGAKIIAIADEFDRHVYPLGQLTVRSIQDAVSHVAGQSGILLDPHWVSLFLDNLDSFDCARNPGELELVINQLEPEMKMARPLEIEGKTILEAGAVIDKETIRKLNGNRNIDPVSTRFVIDINSVLADPPPSIAAEATDDKQDAGKKPVVFAIDDELYVLQALRRELHRSHYDVHCFSKPSEALEAIDNAPPELVAVLTDFNMPGIKGDVLIKRIHRDRPDLPCIVISGETTRDNIQRLIDLGTVHSILRKPWDKDTLVRTLDDLKKERLGV